MTNTLAYYGTELIKTLNILLHRPLVSSICNFFQYINSFMFVSYTALKIKKIFSSKYTIYCKLGRCRILLKMLTIIEWFNLYKVSIFTTKNVLCYCPLGPMLYNLEQSSLTNLCNKQGC